jgi:hypothetical protein
MHPVILGVIDPLADLQAMRGKRVIQGQQWHPVSTND